jgi:hypothetical protein
MESENGNPYWRLTKLAQSVSIGRININNIKLATVGTIPFLASIL